MAHSAKVNLREICDAVDDRLPMLDEKAPSDEQMRRSLARSALFADLYNEAQNGQAGEPEHQQEVVNDQVDEYHLMHVDSAIEK